MRSALTGIEGVESVEVAMPDSVNVTGSADSAVLIAAVKEAGFGASVR